MEGRSGGKEHRTWIGWRKRSVERKKRSERKRDIGEWCWGVVVGVEDGVLGGEGDLEEGYRGLEDINHLSIFFSS